MPKKNLSFQVNNGKTKQRTSADCCLGQRSMKMSARKCSMLRHHRGAETEEALRRSYTPPLTLSRLFCQKKT